MALRTESTHQSNLNKHSHPEHTPRPAENHPPAGCFKRPFQDGRQEDRFAAEWRFPIDEARKSNSLSQIRQEASMKRIRHYPALSEHIWNQLRFRTWDQWLVQGLLLLSAMLLALWLRREHPENREMLTVCSVFFVFAGNICLSRVARLFSWHMAELEQTLYLNLRQMICIRMLEAGIADLIMLVLFLGITGRDSGIGIGASLLYMLVPFLWSDTLYLHILTCLRNTSYRFSSFALGTLCGVLALFPVLWEQAYAPEYRVIWQVLALTGLLLLTAEIRSMLTQIEKGDHICQN